jgi:hypothetical protein
LIDKSGNTFQLNYSTCSSGVTRAVNMGTLTPF